MALTIAEKDLIPEGIAYDPVEKASFVGSIYKRKIVKIDRSGQHTDFTSTGQDGLFEVLGLKVDSKRRVLWACSAAADHTSEKDSSGLFKYDLRTGKLLKKYVQDDESGQHLFNDLVLNAAGTVFLTDSKAGTIYRLAAQSNIMASMVPPGSFAYPNGIALSPDERLLFVADDKGITTINLRNRERPLLQHPEGMRTEGIDGLYFYQNCLLGVQNGIEPERIVRIHLSPQFERVELVEILDVANPLFHIPTTGATVGNQFYFIGNSQLDLLKDDGSLASPDKLEGVRILKLKL